MKESKDDAKYKFVSTDERRCADCVFFVPVQGSIDMDGVCQRVDGIIKRVAVCKNWELNNVPWPYRGREH